MPPINSEMMYQGNSNQDNSNIPPGGSQIPGTADQFHNPALGQRPQKGPLDFISNFFAGTKGRWRRKSVQHQEQDRPICKVWVKICTDGYHLPSAPSGLHRHPHVPYTITRQ